MDTYSYLGNADIATIDSQYQQYIKDPESVEESWAKFFEGFDFARKNYNTDDVASEGLHKEFKVMNLIYGYRSRGHLFTKTNPVRDRRTYSPTLAIENFGLEQTDLETVFEIGQEIGIGPSKLKDIIAHLEETYCKSIGSEFRYIRKPQILEWLQNKMEGTKNSTVFTKEEKLHILHKLTQAVGFEQFLHKKFVGQKRFSLEGGESLIPALDAVVEKGSEVGIQEFIFGMAHRGRLNTLANIFNKKYANIFSEFEGKEYKNTEFDGDVKYHLGYSRSMVADTGKTVHMTMTPNPSHLEAVAPVVQGIARSKVDHYLEKTTRVCPIIIHGDAAIAGQGIAYEVIQMAQLKGYKNGGTMHIVINNQIGFTTNYLDARSSTYCTDVAKTTLSPVFHVNGDDAEAVVHTMQLAIEYRQKYQKDVFVDLLCYRKFGHNEGDEPKFTQPILYKKIASHKNPRELYIEKLIEEGVITNEEALAKEKAFNDLLEKELAEGRKIKKAFVRKFLRHTWRGMGEAKEGDLDCSPETGYNKKKLLKLAVAVNNLPKDKKVFRKIQKLFSDRMDLLNNEGKIDWAMGELLSYASLLEEGTNVRISGQDVERGTFSHRHAVIKVEVTEEEYIPLQHISDKQGNFYIYNSLLSEYGVLGFEYGYAMGSPKDLVIWEAQFGDFFNGAQIIIDQYLSAADDKWHSQNGLVLLLPHGYEGMGSEHSSARIERFLTLCAEDNMQLVNCTTPAQQFHVLRRQLARNFRKPLICFTPKSLLRHPKCQSSIDDIAKGKFQETIDDTLKVKDVDTLVFTFGKIYYELLEKREELDCDNIALVRIEQIFPFPQKQFDAIIKKYKNVKNYLWVQEEPENMGCWTFVLKTVGRQIPIDVISRQASASPASGSPIGAAARQKRIIDRTFEYALVKS
jgi:2-oxoglutarate dehydrogenase E1 component